MNSRSARLRRKFAAFRALAFADRAVVLEFWAIQLAVDFLVLCLPYRWWRGQLIRQIHGDGESPVDASVDRLLRLFTTASNNYPLPFNCLRFSLAVHYALRRRGINSRLNIGVSDPGQGFNAHAWTETGTPSSSTPSVYLGDREFRALRRPQSD